MVVRTTELKQLEKIFENDRNPLVLLYGSMRSQKEQLLRLFAKDKKVFYYRGRNASKEEQLQNLITEVEKQYQIKLMHRNYEECFNRIKSKDASKLVVIIDEFQTIAKKDKDFFESIIKLKEKKLYPGPVMIILCNSSLTWTIRDMDTYLGNAAAKIDYRIKLSDAPFLDVVRAFPTFSVEQTVQTYGILGGVPAYLDLWSEKKNIRQNICATILNPDSLLFEEAENYIGSELREFSVYETILASIARGNEKLNDLHMDTGYSRAKISVYMKNLASFDVIEKVVSFETGGWENVKKGVYRISNHFLNFWFYFVYPHLSDLYLMTPEEFYDCYIQKQLDLYLRRYFVEVCHEYLALMNLVGKVPVKVSRMGTWIGKTGTIDIVGQDEARNTIVGICNWESEYLAFEKYQKLQEDMKKAHLKAEVCYLFSAKAFDEKLSLYAKTHPDVVLVDMKEL